MSIARASLHEADLLDEDDLDGVLGRQSGTRPVARVHEPQGTPKAAEPWVDPTDRPTLKVPRFEVFDGGFASPYSVVANGAHEAMESARSEMPTMRAPEICPDSVPTVPPPRDRSRRPTAFGQIGSLRAIPRVIRTASEIRSSGLDHRQAFVLALIDGHIDVETILDATPLSMHDVLQIVVELVDKNLISLED